MGSLNTYKPNQIELLTDVLDERQWWKAISEIVEFIKHEEARQVELKYGFVVDRDSDGLPQGVDKTISLSDLMETIASGVKEGTIERIGSSDFVFVACEVDLMFMLCNDGDIHMSSTDRSRVMQLGQRLKTVGFTIFDEGKQI